MSMLHIASKKTKSSLTNIHDEDIQPNAVDLRLDKVFLIHPALFMLGTDDVGKEIKRHRGSVEIFPDNEGYFYLHPGNAYEIVMENVIEVGEGEAGWVITRSTLNRNGLYITSGLYDSGYHGVMAGALHVKNGPAKIKKGSRVGQFLLFKSESLKQYDGDYGLGKEHDKKYT
jgi:deoxycytidine triphosphate deaminase